MRVDGDQKVMGKKKQKKNISVYIYFLFRLNF